MLTQCQHCKKTYSLAIEVLCHRHQKRLCPHCKEMLGKLKRLGDDFVVLGQQKKIYRKDVFWSWRWGVWFCLIVLLGQIYMVEKDHLSQNPHARIWLQKICRILPCELPVYHHPDDFEVMFGNLQQTQDNHYLFQAVISNQGLFKQAYPQIKLNLLSFSGDSLAQRIFTSVDYLEDQSQKLIDPAKTVEISMKIIITSDAIGGYTFELI